MKKEEVKPPIKLFSVKVGDVLVRGVGADGATMMKLIVGKTDDEFVYCGSHSEEDAKNPFGPIDWEEGWKFRKSTGLEVDEDLGWNGITTTGTFITKIIIG